MFVELSAPNIVSALGGRLCQSQLQTGDGAPFRFHRRVCLHFSSAPPTHELMRMRVHVPFGRYREEKDALYVGFEILVIGLVNFVFIK